MENKQILVVDDVPENLQLLEEVLSSAGYHIQLFPTGSLALQAAIANPPDLILLDVLMPELSGYELCRQLKAIPALEDIPVIFISALDTPEDNEFPLTEFRLSTEELRNFFCVASMQRSSTRAEQLGISPVAAFVILRSLGGSLDLRRLNPSQGMLTLKLPLSKVL